jgi:tricorn protease
MPWYFRKNNLGKLIGTRTWGGLVAIGGFPRLIDGGSVTAPHTALYGLNGEFEVENHGIAPDIDVDVTPKDFASGHDSQLEAGVKNVLDELAAHPLPTYPALPHPNYHQKDGLGKN